MYSQPLLSGFSDQHPFCPKASRSASVVYPVSLTNARNCTTVTSACPIQKPSTQTSCTGDSSDWWSFSESGLPIRKQPPGTQTNSIPVTGH